MRTKLHIPEAAIPYAQSLGAQYDRSKGEWYVENADDLVPFLCWMDKRLLQPCKPVVCQE